MEREKKIPFKDVFEGRKQKQLAWEHLEAGRHGIVYFITSNVYYLFHSMHSKKAI